MDKKWTVYIHKNKKNKKAYVGITSKKNPKTRWGKNGKKYKGQKFYYAIEKYGWDGFTHEIVATNLTKEQAEQMEIDLIIEYDSIKNGYNNMLGNIPNVETLGYTPDKENGLEALKEYHSLSKEEKITLWVTNKIRKNCSHYEKLYIVKEVLIEFLPENTAYVTFANGQFDFTACFYVLNVDLNNNINKIVNTIVEQVLEQKEELDRDMLTDYFLSDPNFYD